MTQEQFIERVCIEMYGRPWRQLNDDEKGAAVDEAQSRDDWDETWE